MELTRWQRLRAHIGPRPRTFGQTPRLWSIWAAAPFAALVAIAAAGGLFLILRINAHPVAVPGGKPAIDNLEVLKTTVTASAFVGAVLAGVYAYRKQRHAEADSERADSVEFSRRFAQALDHIGSESPAIRLGGVYSMAQLADDWEASRQTCIDVLCAYLKIPARGIEGEEAGEREVRLTIQRLLRAHLSPADGNQDPVRWHRYNFDFSNAVLTDANFANCRFDGSVLFEKTQFLGDEASFAGAAFTHSVSFSDVLSHGRMFMGRANFLGGLTLSGEFREGLALNKATISKSLNLVSAKISGTVNLSEMTALDSNFLIWFSSFAGQVIMEGAQIGFISFDDAKFEDQVDLRNLTLQHLPKFGAATFGGKVHAGGMTIDGKPAHDLPGSVWEGIDISWVEKKTAPRNRPSGRTR